MCGVALSLAARGSLVQDSVDAFARTAAAIHLSGKTFQECLFLCRKERMASSASSGYVVFVSSSLLFFVTVPSASKKWHGSRVPRCVLQITRPSAFEASLNPPCCATDNEGVDWAGLVGDREYCHICKYYWDYHQLD